MLEAVACGYVVLNLTVNVSEMWRSENGMLRKGFLLIYCFLLDLIEVCTVHNYLATECIT